MEGSIEFVLGSMFSGKTTDLMHEAKRAVIAGSKICFIIHSIDTLYGRGTLNKSHDGLSMNVICAPHLQTDPAEVAGVKVIFVDEGHFFAGLKDFCLRQKRRGVRVCVAALASDFNGDPWPEVHALVPAHADKITLKPAVCAVCKRDAMYSRKISGDMTQVVDVGGGEKYIPTCFLHLTEPTNVGAEVLAERRLAVQNVQTLIGGGGATKCN
jgi:thymidine kinase